MSQPAVNVSELDGALGVLPPTAGRPLAVIGCATAGPLNTPAGFGRPKDLVTNFIGGPGIEAACGAVERTGRPVVYVRCAGGTAGTAGTIDDDDFPGDAAPVLSGAATDDFELYWECLTAGTTGTAGIVFQWSKDGGRNMSPPTALGTSLTFEFPGTGVTVTFTTAEAIAVGATFTSRTTAPAPSAVELGEALDALIASTHDWEIVLISSPVDGTAFDTLESKVAVAAVAAGKDRAWVANTRTPNVDETEAQYKTALDTIFSAKSTTYGELCAGACKLTSSVSGHNYRRPIAFAIGALEAAASEEINIADVNRGALRGVSIRDANGNADEHDESLNPGLDDSRFTVLRTHSEFAGVYVNRPRVFSAAGSDFQLLAHRRVMNLAKAAARVYFKRRLNKPVLVAKSTGLILERDALEIESGARALLASVLLAKPKASDVTVSVSRTDNLLSTKTMNVQIRVTPLAYVEFIELDIGFYNPALQPLAVAA